MSVDLTFREATRRSLYECVKGQLDGLADPFGLTAERPHIERCFALLFAESADYPAGGRPPRRSTLNVDGTPIQMSVTLRGSATRLQFLGDVAAPGLSSAERQAAGRVALRRISKLFRADHVLPRIEQIVDRIAPPDDAELLAEPGGAFWLGADFGAACAPKLKVYINARWGPQHLRWARLAEFADWFGAGQQWREIRARVPLGLAPLGVALGARADGAIAGRTYLSGYGQDWPALRALAATFGGFPFERQLQHFGRTVLGDDYGYPTRSVVCSFGVGAARRFADIKIELCGHCAFDSDVQAQQRCLDWLGSDQQAAALYSTTVERLSGGSLSQTGASLHSYIGVGAGNDRTVYFNPAAGTPHDA